MRDTLHVPAPACDDVDDAIAAYGAIEGAWRHVPPSHDFDATVVARARRGDVLIVRGHDESPRHGSATGLVAC